MDNGEACFILSSRNEVDRTAAVSALAPSPARAGGRLRAETLPWAAAPLSTDPASPPPGPPDHPASLGREGLCTQLPPLRPDSQAGEQIPRQVRRCVGRVCAHVGCGKGWSTRELTEPLGGLWGAVKPTQASLWEVTVRHADPSVRGASERHLCGRAPAGLPVGGGEQTPALERSSSWESGSDAAGGGRGPGRPLWDGEAPAATCPVPPQTTWCVRRSASTPCWPSTASVPPRPRSSRCWCTRPAASECAAGAGGAGAGPSGGGCWAPPSGQGGRGVWGAVWAAPGGR